MQKCHFHVFFVADIAMLVTLQLVANITINQNVMPMTDILCRRHDFHLGAKFNKDFVSFTATEVLIFMTDILLVTNIKTRHQHIWTPTSM